MFVTEKTLIGSENTPAIEVFAATESETFTEGEALILSGGKLTKCGATAKPCFISAKSVSSAPAGTRLPVYVINAAHVFRTKFSATPTDLAAGDKVTLSSDGLTVTATETSGVAEIFDMLGASQEGDEVLVRFN